MESYVEFQVPFCKPFNCSFNPSDGTTNNSDHVLWNCVPENCKSSVIVFLSIAVMLAAMTITFNCLILGINLASKTRRMRKRNPTMSNYSVYVVSLAVADLLVGVIVLPLCLINFYLEFMVDEITNSKVIAQTTPFTPSWASVAYTGIPGGKIAELSGDSNPALTTAAGQGVAMVRNQPIEALVIRGALGIFTHLTLFVSVYTLITASADRFYAATYSAHFWSSQITKSTAEEKKTCFLGRLVRSVQRSTIAVCSVWIIGIIFATLPVAVSDLHFRQVGHIFAAMTSEEQYSSVVNWYLSTLVIPLIGIWVLNLMICFTLWRRKRQLGLRRRRSLRRNRSSDEQNRAPPSPRLATNSDSVFEVGPAEGHVVVKYPASRWNREDSTEVAEVKSQFNGSHPLYRNKPSNASVGTPKSPRGFMSPPKSPGSFQSFNWESKGTILRRKVSSIRRAKEMLKRQSYEANITKTLCIVVVAFTLAVLPLVISLSKISTGNSTSKEVLNKEVTALTCSLLLLFSNSFVNCVIYGARMRDFRTTLCQLLRTFVDKIKNTLCCCCSKSNDNFSSEVVNGVFLLTKHHKSDVFPVSPRLRGASALEKLRSFSHSSSKLSQSREATLDRKAAKHDEETAPFHPGNIYPANREGLATFDKRNPRPSSSGYRTDPEPHSIHDDAQKKGRSQRSNKDDLKDFVMRNPETSPEVADDSTEAKVEISPPVQLDSEKYVERSSLCEGSFHHKDQLEDALTVQEVTTSEQNTSKYPQENELVRDIDEVSKATSGDHGSHTSVLRESTDFTIDIDFSQFSTLEKNISEQS